MALLADGFLLIAALVSSTYCVVLSRRLARLNGLDAGLGQAIVQLTQRVDLMNSALAAAKTANETSARTLQVALDDAVEAEKRLKSLTKTTLEIASSSKNDDPSEAASNEVKNSDATKRFPDAIGPIEPTPRASQHAIDLIGSSPAHEDDGVFADRLSDAISSLQANNGPQA